MSLPSYHILPRPTLASSAILPLPCPTLSYPILHCFLLPSYHFLPRPTLDSSTILPHPTLSYPSLPHPTSSYTGFFCHPTPTLSYLILHSILLPSYRILPRPTLESSGLLGCWLNKVVEPTLSYPSLPQPASSYSGLFSHPTLAYPFIQPSTSYTGVVIHPTPSYHILPQPSSSYTAVVSHPSIQWFSSLPYATPSYQNTPV